MAFYGTGAIVAALATEFEITEDKACRIIDWLVERGLIRKASEASAAAAAVAADAAAVW